MGEKKDATEVQWNVVNKPGTPYFSLDPLGFFRLETGALYLFCFSLPTGRPVFFAR
jgi:hypothetical protein